MRYGARGRGSIVGVAAALVLTLTSCGGGGDDKPGSAAKEPGTGPERAAISVGMLPVPDVAPLYIAIQKGYFKAEGLTVTPELMTGTAAALTKQAGGGLDIILGNYMSVFTAQEKGVGKFKYIADGYQAGANGFNVMVKADSTLKSGADLRGKKVAVNSIGNIGDLSVVSSIKSHGLGKGDVQWVELPFPEQAKALDEGRIDAGWLTEPFITYAQKQFGAKTLIDTMSGATKDFPISGWSATEKFIAENPRTIAAFQRAIGKAQAEAAADREEVTKVVPTYTKMDKETAAVISLGAFPTSLSSTRLQRVADLMLELKFLSKPLDVSSMLAGPAQ